MNRIETFLIEKCPRLGLALYAFKHGGDSDYYKKALQTDPSVFQYHTLGNKNPDKNIFYIRIGDSGDGFFAEYNRLLMYLFAADKYNMIPVVLFTDKFLYREECEVNGSSNPFQYYFLEPSGIYPEEAEESKNVVYSSYVHTLQKELMDEKTGLYGFSDKYIEILGGIDRKYIRTNPAVDSYLAENLSAISKDDSFERIIGIHFRGTDFRAGLMGHPKYMTPERTVKKAEELLDTGDYDGIFLATDDAGALQLFMERFGDRIKYYKDVFRSEGDSSVAFSDDGRDLHHYRLGLEVYRDMETLSRCGALIAGLSQVSLASRIKKEGRREKYRDICILDPGIIKKGPSLERYYRKAGKQVK